MRRKPQLKKQMESIKIEKKVKLNKFEIVKYQLMHHCFMNKIKLNETEMNCLALLGEVGQVRLTDFGVMAVEKGILGNPATVHNCMSKIEKSGLFIKKGTGKIIIYLNPDLQIKSEGNILLELKIFKLEAKPTKSNIQENSKTLEPAGGTH